MERTIRRGPHCVTLLHRVTGASSTDLDAAVAALPQAEREQLDVLAGEILNDARNVAHSGHELARSIDAGRSVSTEQPGRESRNPSARTP